MTKEVQNTKDKKKYDLEERTAKFGENILKFCRSLKGTPINKPLISQVVRSATSIGANYMEADAAESKKDFKHKIALCRKESKETMHWLRMISQANPDYKETCKTHRKEAKELTLIFSTIFRGKS